jgi:hypothetical protein
MSSSLPDVSNIASSKDADCDAPILQGAKTGHAKLE